MLSLNRSFHRNANIQKTKEYARAKNASCFESTQKKDFKTDQRKLWSKKERLDGCQKHV